MVEALVEILVDVALFLDLSDDATVDPDSAVEQLDTIVYRLKSLSRTDKERVATLIRAQAVEAAAAGARKEVVECIENLPSGLGLVEDEEDS